MMKIVHFLQNFFLKKKVHQGNPLSPILFNLISDILAILISCAKRDGQLSGHVPHLVEDGLSMLQSVDETILLTDHNLQEARKLKIILCALEHWS